MIAPTITHGLDFAAYLNLPGESFTTLKHIDTSPLHYLAAKNRPKKDTGPMRLGRTVHSYLLEPDAVFETKPVLEGRILYDGERRGNAWKAFKTEHAGKEIVTVGDIEKERLESQEIREKAEAMRDAVWRHEEAAALLTGGRSEVTIQWTHAATGLLVRNRIDYLGAAGGVVDLKSTRSIDPRRFQVEIARRAYHAQSALYGMGSVAVMTNEQLCGPTLTAHIIAVENIHPFDVDVYELGEAELAAGAYLAEKWLRTVAGCQASGRWPGVGAGKVRKCKLPEWAYGDCLDVELELDGESI